MTKQTVSSTARVGILVIVAGILLYGAFIFLGGRLEHHGNKYFVLMSDAGGVVKGTRISMSGVRIGEVVDVTLVDPRHVRLAVEVEKRYKIPAGSVAEIPVQFISIGDAGMIIVPPDAITADLPPGSSIVGRHPGPLDQVFPDSKKTIDNVNDILLSMKKLLQDEDLKGNIKGLLTSSTKTMEEFSKLAASTNSMLAKNQANISGAMTNANLAMLDVQKGASLVYKLINEGKYQDKANALLKHLDTLSAKTETLMDNLNKFVSNPELHDTLNATLQNAKEISDQGKLMATKVDKILDNGTVVSSKAIELTDQATALATESKNLVAKIEGLVDKVEGKVSNFKLPSSPIGQPHAEIRAIRDTHPNYNRIDVNAEIPAFGQDFYVGVFDAFASDKLNFQLGKHYGSNTVLRYGAYAGTAGLGVDYRIAPRLGLETNVFNVNKPRFDALLKYDFGNGFGTWIGMDRIFDRNGLALGVSFQK